MFYNIKRSFSNLLFHVKCLYLNLLRYKNILWSDCNYDYSFLLDIEKLKFQLMIQHFKSTPHVNHKRHIRWISVCIKLNDIIKDNIFNNEIELPYVNIQNCSRFNYSSDHIKFWSDITKQDLRSQKAFYLYHKIRYNYMQEWWD